MLTSVKSFLGSTTKKLSKEVLHVQIHLFQFFFFLYYWLKVERRVASTINLGFHVMAWNGEHVVLVDSFHRIQGVGVDVGFGE